MTPEQYWISYLFSRQLNQILDVLPIAGNSTLKWILWRIFPKVFVLIPTSFSCYPLNLLLIFFEGHVAILTLKLNTDTQDYLIFYVTVFSMPNLKTQLAIRALKLSKTFSEPAKSAAQRNRPILCIHYMQDNALRRHSLFYLLQGDLSDQEGDGQGLRRPVNSIRTAAGFSGKSDFWCREWPARWKRELCAVPAVVRPGQ